MEKNAKQFILIISHGDLDLFFFHRKKLVDELGRKEDSCLLKACYILSIVQVF